MSKTSETHPTEHSYDKGDILDPIPVEDAQNSETQVVSFETDELTAWCPYDFGGPDFYHLVVRYIPTTHGIESKSFKKYIESWRDAEISGEDLATAIHDDIKSTGEFSALYVRAEQARRGGVEETVEVGDVHNDQLRVGARSEVSDR